ncbi:hypothetical protein NQ176_g4657 [Zarea fungicola]|uniref:Uncharacterized protein n=1 Tax=Zarea fungicola TaxID=93591 RepID=A0ACC1NE87_9HYPO|nr:hypothetical protein NQ176_g4657 [Lecanicillium fungicola]
MVQATLGAMLSSAVLGSLGGFDSVALGNNDSQSLPVANLSGIGQYRACQLSESLSGLSLPRAVDAWLGVDYALQPILDRRFRPLEQPPEYFAEIKEANSFGPICVQDQSSGYGDEQSEACLNFNVYRPTGVPLTQKLPTLVWIHGGAFSLYSGRAMDGGSFVASSEQPVMVVTFNYRLNSLGFLPTAFEYFHNYDGDKDAPLFARVILQSGAITARAFPDVSYPRYEDDFRTLMQYIGCDVRQSDEEQIDCLRKAPVAKIREISSQIYADAESNLSWPWQPVVGGPRLERPGSQCYQERTFHPLPIITTHTTDEGKYYTPGNLETNDDFIRFWQNLSPYLNVTDLAILNELYPDPVAHPDSIWGSSPNSTQYNRLSGSWSDMAYICPSRETAYRTSSKSIPTWRLRFNTPAHPLEAHGWRGIPHASDMAYLWNERSVPFPEVARMYHSYMASFVAGGDPNEFRLPGAPEWPSYRTGDGISGGCPKQLSVNPGDGTKTECDNVRLRQCEFWNDAERATRLNK